jgi:nitrite reductase/ring-hydroxylating ferredoxin subunit
MTAPAEWRCDADELPPGRTATFRLTCGGRTVHGFVVNHAGSVHAYVNACPHVGSSLDLFPNEFLTEDGSLIVCASHGALFAPDSGECLAGPCAGDALTPLPVRVEGRALVVTCGGP